MKIAIAGASGLVGTHLVQALARRGDEAIKLPRFGTGPWNVDGADAVVNLSGENLFNQRWNSEFKKKIVDSRVLTTRALVEAIARATKKPRVLVNASAVGFYGDRGDEILDESASPGSDFLAEVTRQWEHEAQQASVRSVEIRTGIVLAKKGGALEKMVPPFKAFAGGPIGNGRQWFPWIHIDDEVGGILHAIDNDSVQGPVNFSAPGILTMKDFAKALGRALHRPSWAAVPGPVLKIALGEVAEVLLGGQHTVPKKLQATGYEFRFENASDALADLFG
jgi:uncharacterized protein